MFGLHHTPDREPDDPREITPLKRKGILDAAVKELIAHGNICWDRWLPANGSFIARPLEIVGLPLPGNPYAPDEDWQQRAIAAIKTLYPYAGPSQQRTIAVLLQRPDWIHLDIRVFAPDVPTWRGASIASQFGPFCNGCIIKALGLAVPESHVTVRHVGNMPGHWAFTLWADDGEELPEKQAA
jgi:hypothetical protein